MGAHTTTPGPRGPFSPWGNTSSSVTQLQDSGPRATRGQVLKGIVYIMDRPDRTAVESTEHTRTHGKVHDTRMFSACFQVLRLQAT